MEVNGQPATRLNKFMHQLIPKSLTGAACALMIGLGHHAKADTTVTTFDNFASQALYGSWATATINSTTSNYVITATGYGSNWKYLGGINGAGNTNIELNVSLSGPIGASNQLGPIVSLVDNDGTYVNYAWYGQPLGNNLVLTGSLFAAIGSPGFAISTNTVGSVPGLDLSNLQHMHMALDPGGFGVSGAYTIAWNDLKLTDGSSSVAATGVCAVVESFNNHVLGGLYAGWSAQTSNANYLQIVGTGWGGGFAAVTPNINTESNKTIQVNITMAASAAADGKLGPLVILEDGDGTQIRYAWFGQNPGTNLVLTSALSGGTIVAPGTVAGFDYTAILFFHLQLDPSTYAGSYTLQWNDISIMGCDSGGGDTGFCATISSFDNFFMDGVYVNWQSANEISGANSWQMTATGFGGGFANITPDLSTASNRTLQLTLTLAAPPAAAGKLGPLAILEDADGTQLRYAWFGQSPGTNLVLTSALSAGVNVQAGTIAGFDYNNVSYFHLQLDPSSYAGSYDFIAQDLSLFGCPAVSIEITAYSYDPNTGQFTLTWTSESGATYAVQSGTNPTSLTDLVTGIPSTGATTTATVTPGNPNMSFLRIRKQ